MLQVIYFFELPYLNIYISQDIKTQLVISNIKPK